MALTLPGWLVEAIRYLGYHFPQSNEDVLRSWADHIRAMDKTCDAAHADVVDAIRTVTEANAGPTADSFSKFVTAGDSDADALTKLAAGCEIAAKGCDICASALVILKGVVLFQLGLLAPALVAGPASFLLKKGVEYAIDKAVEKALDEVLE